MATVINAMCVMSTLKVSKNFINIILIEGGRLILRQVEECRTG